MRLPDSAVVIRPAEAAKLEGGLRKLSGPSPIPASDPHAATSGTVSVEFCLNPVNGWFIRLFALPVVMIDGGGVPASWKHRGVYSLELGPHTVSASLKYRRTPWLLGTGECRIQVTEANREFAVIARNGVMNQTPFRLSVHSISMT